MNVTNISSLALVNGKIWTVNQNQPRAEAVAMLENKIIAVGSTEQIKNIIDSTTHVIDLKGKFALPGFNDAHVHFFDGAVALQSVDLRDAKNEHDFIQRIKNYVAGQPAGTWILRGNWDHETWKSQRLPTKELIDPITPNHPVFINRIDDHIALANSLALKIAGVHRDTPNPPGGEIKKDPDTGEPTGILLDKAWNLVLRKVPPLDFFQTRQVIEQGLKLAARYGVTSFQDNSSAMDMQVYQSLLNEGKLTARVNAWRPAELLTEFKELGIRANFGDDMLRLGVLKVYTDGSMGAGSALFFEPYSDDPSTRGLAIVEKEELQRIIIEGNDVGLQLAIHAIGDKANSMVLDALESAGIKNNHNSQRHRIEHAQVVTSKDLHRYQLLGVIASIQPSHCIDDMVWAAKRIGFERCKNSYRVKSFFDLGIPVAFGTDWAVEPLNPMLGLYAAVTRESVNGGPPGGWFPNEKISITEAIAAYTLGSAFAEFSDHKKGSIEAGKLADIVVLSKNLLEIQPAEILQTEVLYTIVDGKIVYRKE